MSQCMDIDGSVLEGGGQILRNSISMSAVLGIPIRIMNIRAGRSKPGLAAQHLTGVQLVADMCNAKLKGAYIGSTEIEFTPGKIRGGRFLADTKTAGSISLLIQVALPCALMADRHVTMDLRGGTNADMAPQIDYMDKVFSLILQKFKADFTLNIHRRGFYPRGGGHVTAEVDPVRKLCSAEITLLGRLQSIKGLSFISGNLPIEMANENRNGALDQLFRLCPDPARIEINSYKEDQDMAPDNGNGIILRAETSSGCVVGADGLGGRGMRRWHVGAAAAKRLKDAVLAGACLDPHAQDQVIIFMALAEGKSAVRVGKVTLHTKTAIHVAELMAKTKFTIQPDGKTNIIKCTGLGLINQNLPPE